MDTQPLMASAAEEFGARLLAEPDCRRLALPSKVSGSPGMRWDNLLLASPGFRRAHVELLDVPGRLTVLHVCVFPHLDDPAPIFGFDMVAGPARVTGIFLDLSPVVAPASWPGDQPSGPGGQSSGPGDQPSGPGDQPSWPGLTRP